MKQLIEFRQGLIIMAALFIISSCRGYIPDEYPEITFNEIPEQNRIEVFYDDELFTAYIYPEELAKPVLFPVHTHKGNLVTRGYPLEPRPGERVDHPHQVGIWLNYGDVNGLDFWNNPGNVAEENKDRYGFIQHNKLIRSKEGTGNGILEVYTLWKDYRDVVILEENTVFRFAADGNTRLIDRITILKAAEDVLFADNKEGMMAIRVARELELPAAGPVRILAEDNSIKEAGQEYHNKSTGNYLSGEGLEGNSVWGKRASWMRLSGQIDEEQVTLAIIDHPDNPGYPTYWHARGYGLFSANPLGQSEFSDGEETLNYSLSAGDSVTFRYRIMVHSGSILPEGTIDHFAKDFSTVISH